MAKVKKKCLFCKEVLGTTLVHNTFGQGVATECKGCGSRGPIMLNASEALASYKIFKKKKDSNPLELSSDAHRLAEELLMAILKSVPKIKPPNLTFWAREMDAMMRVDERDISLIEEMIEWLPTTNKPNGFCWSGVTLSASSFRKNFDKLQGAKGMSKTKGNWDTKKTTDYGKTKGF